MTAQTAQKWNKVKLGDIADVTSSKRIYASDYVEKGIPFYRSKEVIEKNKGNSVSTELYISNEKFSEIRAKFGAPREGDMLITSVGTLGVPYLVRQNEVFYFKDGNLIWLRDFDTKKVTPKFIYYTAIGSDFQKRIKGIAIGSSQSAFTISAIKEFEIEIPNLSTQKQIADVLSAYDELIENNNRRIKILEETAQKIYKEWFVNFRFPGYEKVKMVNSGTELGMIPEGWEMKKLRDVISFYIGGGWGEEKESEDFCIPGYVIRGTDIPAVYRGDISTAPFRFHKESNMKSRKVEAFDIVFEVSGGSKGQPVGRHALITDVLLEMFSSNVIFASFCKLIRVNKDIVSPYNLSLLFNKLYEEEIISKYQVQSTGISNFRFEDFIDEVSMLVSDKTTARNFDELVGTIFALIHRIGSENINLKKTRDLLIPQLVGGKLEVK